MWYPITTDDGRLHIIEESDANLSTVFWRAELSGVKAPRSFLRNGHAVLVKVRYGIDLSWENLLLGWIDGFSVDDDYQRLARWKIDLVSIHGMLAKVGQDTIIAGDRNIAKHGRIVKQDHPLSFPHKEFAAGEPLSAESDTSAKSAIDGDPNTLWIADRLMGGSLSTIMRIGRRVSLPRASTSSRPQVWVQATALSSSRPASGAPTTVSATAFLLPRTVRPAS